MWNNSINFVHILKDTKRNRYVNTLLLCNEKPMFRYPENKRLIRLLVIFFVLFVIDRLSYVS